MRPINTSSANQDRLTTPQSIGSARSYPHRELIIINVDDTDDNVDDTDDNVDVDH